MDALEIVKEARALLSTPEHWTKGEFAYDESGEPVAPVDDSAVCFCLMGAIERVADVTYFSQHHTRHREGSEPGLQEIRRIDSILHQVIETISGEEAIDTFNDHEERKHEDILEVLDKTIAVLTEDAARAVAAQVIAPQDPDQPVKVAP